jgi:hypothetical protein
MSILRGKLTIRLGVNLMLSNIPPLELYFPSCRLDKNDFQKDIPQETREYELKTPCARIYQSRTPHKIGTNTHISLLI